MIVAVSGHRFYGERAGAYLHDAVGGLLDSWLRSGPVRVVTSLAEGADQLVASEALARGATLDVVVPSEGFRASLDEAYRGEYDRLLAAADDVEVRDHHEPGSDAYLEAGLAVLDRADVLLALWDGEPARGVGGTGDVVEAARARGTEVVVVWPAGYERA